MAATRRVVGVPARIDPRFAGAARLLDHTGPRTRKADR